MVWVLFLLLPKELVPLVILTQRYYLKTVQGLDSPLSAPGHRGATSIQEYRLESQLLEEPSVLAALVLLLELGPHHHARLLLLHRILDKF